MLKKQSPFVLLFPGLAVPAYLLLSLLYRMEDEKGLLPRLHPVSFVLLAITLAVLVIAFVYSGRQRGTVRYADNFPKDILGALSCLAMAAAIYFSEAEASDAVFPILLTLHGWLKLGAVGCLAVLAVFRLLGRRPPLLLGAVITLFFVLHLVSRYQVWSSQPQMARYVYSLLGGVSLALYSYQFSAFCVGMGEIEKLDFFGLAGCFLCLTAVAGGELPLMYGVGAVWLLCGLCAVQPEAGK